MAEGGGPDEVIKEEEEVVQWIERMALIKMNGLPSDSEAFSRSNGKWKKLSYHNKYCKSNPWKQRESRSSMYLS